MKEASLDAFDFLVVAFLNIGMFSGRNDGSTGGADAEFFTLPAKFIRENDDASSSWHKVRLRGLDDEIAPFNNDAGFEMVAEGLGIRRPKRLRVAGAT